MSLKPRERTGGFRALAETVAGLTRPMLGKRGFASGAIISGWKAIVGERLAAHVVPERIAFPRGRQEGGTLHLRLATGALATELQHLEPRIIERINTAFGFAAVARLKLIHAPLPVSGRSPSKPPTARPIDPGLAAKLAADLADISDPRLQGVLFALGSAILGQQTADSADTGEREQEPR